MRQNPKQIIKRGIKEVKHANGSRENAVYSWDITDQDAMREGNALVGLQQLRPDTRKYNEKA